MGRTIVYYFVLGLFTHQGLSADFQFQCSSQISMDPELGGRPQYVGENPPPYNFYFLKDNGESSKRYSDNVFTIRLNSSTNYFKGFLIQARLATKHGHIVGAYRAGEFMLDNNAKKQGVKFLDCPSILNDSITHSNNEQKNSIEAKWIDHKREGPVQFLITVIQEKDTYWVSWAPKSGLVFPVKRTPAAVTPSPTPEIVTEPPTINSKEGKESENTGGNGEEPVAATELKPADESEGGGDDSPKGPPVTIARTTRKMPKVIIHKEKFVDEEEMASTAPPDLPPAEESQPNETEPPNIPDKVETPDKISEAKGLPPDAPKNNEKFIVSSDRGSNVPKGGSGSSEQKRPVSIRILTPAEEAPRGAAGPRHLSEAEVPQHIIQEHLLEVSSNGTDVPDIDMCASDPCLHNGTCESFPGERRFQCTCTSQWVGEQCEETNHCFTNECKNGAACVLGDGDYSCQCTGGWGGPRCESHCPEYLCKNGGSCIIAGSGDYRCACKPGWTGATCDREADACSSFPCQNGGNCTNKITSFECRCKTGYMGELCHRACQDVYKSCEFWKQEDKCDQMRPTTSFFDINCPVSCEQCTFDNTTIRTKTPLPFLLEPFAFLIGTWYADYSSPLRYPMDFEFAPDGYQEELSFIVPPVNMFGTPYLNYSSRAYNKAYGTWQTNLGFVTLKPVSDPMKVAIMSVGNDGLTIIEEGDIKPNNMRLTSKYLLAHPLIEKVPLKLNRKFYFDGSYLEERITRIRADSVSETFTRYYTKHVVKPFY